jgi:hypothetical protein
MSHLLGVYALPTQQLRRSASSCNICTGQIMTHDEELCQP